MRTRTNRHGSPNQPGGSKERLIREARRKARWRRLRAARFRQYNLNRNRMSTSAWRPGRPVRMSAYGAAGPCLGRRTPAPGGTIVAERRFQTGPLVAYAHIVRSISANGATTRTGVFICDIGLSARSQAPRPDPAFCSRCRARSAPSRWAAIAPALVYLPPSEKPSLVDAAEDSAHPPIHRQLGEDDAAGAAPGDLSPAMAGRLRRISSSRNDRQRAAISRYKSAHGRFQVSLYSPMRSGSPRPCRERA